MTVVDQEENRAEILKILKELPERIAKGETKNLVLLYDDQSANNFNVGIMSNKPRALLEAMIYACERVDDVRKKKEAKQKH